MRIENKLNYKYRILILISLVAIVLARPLIANNLEYNVERVEHNFNHPWSSATLPNGDILVTELIGKIKRIDIKTREVIDINGIPNVLFRGQGGLSDIILHPEFEKNNIVLISFSYGEKNKNTLKVISAELIRNELINKKIIFEATPYRKSSNHYGARLVFLNDNSLIITSGDGLIIVKMHKTLIIILVKLFVLMLMALFQKIILTLIHKMLCQKFFHMVIEISRE